MKCINELKRVILIFLFISLIYIISILVNKPIGCFIEGVFGIECPSCGQTSAWYHLLINHDIKTAFYYHPLFLFPLIAGILLLLNEFILSKKNKIITYILIIMLIIYIGLYIIRIFIDIENVIPLDTKFEFILFKLF